jgi:hypothetical protein
MTLKDKKDKKDKKEKATLKTSKTDEKTQQEIERLKQLGIQKQMDLDKVNLLVLYLCIFSLIVFCFFLENDCIVKKWFC